MWILRMRNLKKTRKRKNWELRVTTKRSKSIQQSKEDRPR